MVGSQLSCFDTRRACLQTTPKKGSQEQFHSMWCRAQKREAIRGFIQQARDTLGRARHFPRYLPTTVLTVPSLPKWGELLRPSEAQECDILRALDSPSTREVSPLKWPYYGMGILEIFEAI